MDVMGEAKNQLLNRIPLVRESRFGIELEIPHPEALKNYYLEEKRLGRDLPFPFWSKVWPAALGLCRYLEENPKLVENKRLLELGAGLGLPSFLCSKTAVFAIASDYNEDAVGLIAHNIRRNQIRNLEAIHIDWNKIPEDLVFDIVLMSDVNYAPADFGPLLKTIQTLIRNKTKIILSSPQRLAGRDFVKKLGPDFRDSAHYELEGQEIRVYVS